MLKLHPVWNYLHLLPVDQDIELSAPSLALCLPACHHAFLYDDKVVKMGNYKSVPAK